MGAGVSYERGTPAGLRGLLDDAIEAKLAHSEAGVFQGFIKSQPASRNSLLCQMWSRIAANGTLVCSPPVARSPALTPVQQQPRQV